METEEATIESGVSALQEGAEPWMEAFSLQAQSGPWLTAACGDSHLLPYWSGADEKSAHGDAILEFHTKQCPDFQRGFCAKHGARGKASQCLCYHFDSQRRRSPVDPSTGQLRYWETPCPAWTAEMGFCCLAGDSCTFAHGREEVSYHPSKYKTRACNGHDCRGEGACCFAHGDEEVRHWAPGRYSYLAAATTSQSTSGGNATATQAEARPRKAGAIIPGTTATGATVSGKVRFCASYPNVSQCRRGSACAFAHTRDEVQTPLLSLEEEEHQEVALTQAFFTRKFKTMWCPIGAQHDWQTCVYAHTYQDARRMPSIGYGPQPCPYWGKKDTRVTYAQRCPLGLRCPYAHGAKEQLYHPKYFRTVTCRDMQMKGCPRQRLCAFYHRRAERRKQQTPDTMDYGKPLPKEAIDEKWGEQFLNPPIFQEGLEGEEGMLPTGFAGYGGSYWPVSQEHPGDGAESPRTSSTGEESEAEPTVFEQSACLGIAGSLKGSFGKSFGDQSLASPGFSAWFQDGFDDSTAADMADWGGLNYFYTSYTAGHDEFAGENQRTWWDAAAGEATDVTA